MYNYRLRAKNLFKKYGTYDPVTIASCLRIKVFPAELPPSVNGMWKRVLRRKYIAYNINIQEEWQIMAVVGHELGHILLHPSYRHFCSEGRTFYASTKREQEADEMAVTLCCQCTDVDEKYIRDFLKNGWKEQNLYEGVYA